MTEPGPTEVGTTCAAAAGAQVSRLLSAHTTLRVGGPARRLAMVGTEQDLKELVWECDRTGEPLFILSGGSNLLFSDQGFDGTVARIATRGIAVESLAAGQVLVRVAAGEPWDNLVATAVAESWIGAEALSGIPGLVGAAPVQNIGAYGAEVSQLISSVRTIDRRTGAMRDLLNDECGFGYRMSRFKADPGRHVIVEVTFSFQQGKQSAQVRYGELASRLGIEVGQTAPLALVRDAVFELRRSKGMVLDPADHDTWSAGSFFTNPIIPSAELLPAGAPRFDLGDGSVKTSAAWLIEQAGFGKGYGYGPAGLSSKHVLALTNRGDATAADLISLAREVRDGVRNWCGIELHPEPVLVGLAL